MNAKRCLAAKKAEILTDNEVEEVSGGFWTWTSYGRPVLFASSEENITDIM